MRKTKRAKFLAMDSRNLTIASLEGPPKGISSTGRGGGHAWGYVWGYACAYPAGPKDGEKTVWNMTKQRNRNWETDYGEREGR